MSDSFCDYYIILYYIILKYNYIKHYGLLSFLCEHHYNGEKNVVETIFTQKLLVTHKSKTSDSVLKK